MTRAFIALYRGRTVASAHLVAVSSDPQLVAEAAARILGQPIADDGDPVIARIERGRRSALRAIRREGGVGDS